ncbi:MAG: ATP-binding protein, partial [Candidatus Omnitrophica bacterium]|nr:ATP-binding protein [Candidatus Omnitrophota bacterium]
RKDFSLKRYPLLAESNLTDIELRIKDSGRGIEEDVLDKIFEPFYSGNKGGTGLGLAISRKIIEEHNGRIDAESKVGVGTTFIVKLPVNVIESKYLDTTNNSNKNS